MQTGVLVDGGLIALHVTVGTAVIAAADLAWWVPVTAAALDTVEGWLL